MTTEELNQYDSLSESDKQQYITLKSLHPDWNHEQLMCKFTFNNQFDYTYIEQDKSATVFMGDIACDESLWDKFKNMLR